MSARVPAGFIETTPHWTAPGQQGDIITAMGWSGDAPLLPTDFEDIGAALTNLRVGLNWKTKMYNVTITVGQDGPDDLSVDVPVNGVGSFEQDMIPINTSYLVNKVSQAPGRRGRGRMFLPGVSEGAVGDDGIVEAGSVASLQTAVDNVVTQMATLGYTPVLFHQKPPFTPSLISAYSVQKKVATQRRRFR